MLHCVAMCRVVLLLVFKVPKKNATAPNRYSERLRPKILLLVLSHCIALCWLLLSRRALFLLRTL